MKISRKKALKELDNMLAGLRSCELENQKEVGLGVAAAHFFACRIGIISDKELALRTVKIAACMAERERKAKEVAP